ncbi:MAG: hypothetical protein LBV72_19825 [Tannerella sp.]|jgi:hypothetical protein|nr:hypothetical protein [Tannerella sp.]
MKTIQSAVTQELKALVPELNWIDLDRGQIDLYHADPSIQYPCALIDVALYECESIYHNKQQSIASITLRIVQNPNEAEADSTPTPEQAHTTSLQCYDLIDKVYLALQGFEIGNLCPLSRFEQQKEERYDGLFVYRIEFRTILDDLAS